LISQKYDDMLNPTSKLFNSQFDGNKETKYYLIGVLNKMKEIEKGVTGTKAQKLVELKNFVKQDFIAHISSGDTTGHLCSCQALFQRNFFNPRVKYIVKTECQRLCKTKKTLDFDGELLSILDVDEE
jgi:hypothetical protein